MSEEKKRGVSGYILWLYIPLFLIIVILALWGIFVYGYQPIAAIYIMSRAAVLVLVLVLVHAGVLFLVWAIRKKRNIREEVLREAAEKVKMDREEMKKEMAEERKKIQKLAEEVRKREENLREREKKIETYIQLLKEYEAKFQRTNAFIGTLRRICFVDGRSEKERWEWLRHKIFKWKG